MLFSAIGWGFSLLYFTCAVNAVSVISWFACTNIGAFSIVTESIGVAVTLSCLTLVYVCKIINRMHWFIQKNIFFNELFLQSSVEIFRTKSFENHFDDYCFLWLRAIIREVAKPDDTALHGKTNGLLVMSFPIYLQKRKCVFYVYLLY